MWFLTLFTRKLTNRSKKINKCAEKFLQFNSVKKKKISAGEIFMRFHKVMTNMCLILYIFCRSLIWKHAIFFFLIFCWCFLCGSERNLIQLSWDKFSIEIVLEWKVKEWLNLYAVLTLNSLLKKTNECWAQLRKST